MHKNMYRELKKYTEVTPSGSIEADETVELLVIQSMNRESNCILSMVSIDEFRNS